jgi:hypothetical protein
MGSKTEITPPWILAEQALSSASGRQLVIESLRVLARRQHSGTEIIEQTGAYIYKRGGVEALQRTAALAETWHDDTAEITRHHLLSGFWRT